MEIVVLLFLLMILQSAAQYCHHTIPDKNDRVLLLHGDVWCCACNKGEKVANFCQFNNSDTTECALCVFDEMDNEMQTYVEYGPHLQNQCNKSIASCPPGFTRLPGNRTAPAKCIDNSYLERLQSFSQQTCDQNTGIPFPFDVIAVVLSTLTTFGLVVYICMDCKKKSFYTRVPQNVNIQLNQLEGTVPTGDNRNSIGNMSNCNGHFNYRRTENIDTDPHASGNNHPHCPHVAVTSPTSGSVNVPGPPHTAGIPNGQASPQQATSPQPGVLTANTTTDGASSLPLLGAGPMQEPTSTTTSMLHRDQRTINDNLSAWCPKCGLHSNTKTTPQSLNKAKKKTEKNLLDQIALVLAKMLTQADATFFLRTFGASTDDIDEAKSKAADARDMFFRVFEKCERSPCGQKLDSKNILEHLEKNHLTDCASEVRNIIAENDS